MQRLNENIMQNVEQNTPLANNHISVDCVVIGFDGENGRNFAKSTGMGLFICKKLCGKLGLSISLDSVLGQGTTVTITFPVGNMHLLED